MNNSVEILLVEDSRQDAELIIRSLRKHNVANNLLHLKDGQDALDYLYSESNSGPRVIMLDLKMPRVDGLEVLRKLKSDPEKRKIPVVVLTSSKEEQDVIEAYDLGVNAYLVKPLDFQQFADAIHHWVFFGWYSISPRTGHKFLIGSA